jgi:hypothetical protein
MSATKRLRDADFPIPQHISDDKLNAFFEGYGFGAARANRMSSWLKDLVDEYSKFMTDARGQKTRIDDLANLAASLEEIERAIFHLKACGPVGRGIARNGVHSLGKMFSVLWLIETFPNDDDLPQPEFPTAGRPGRTTRTPMRVEKFHIEEHTQEARARFAQARNLTLMIAALDQFEQALKAALRSAKRSGRDPCVYRHSFIVDLAICWQKIGYNAASSNFLDFCQYVFEEIGWPTDGLKRAKDKALADLRPGR